MADGTAQVRGISEQFLICSHCNKKFTDPKKLPCLHSICLKCLIELSHSEKQNCPTCYTLIDVKGPYESLPNDHFVTSLLNALNLDINEETGDVADVLDSVETAKQGVKNKLESTKRTMERECQKLFDKKVQGERRKMQISTDIITQFSTLRQKMQRYLMEQEHRLLEDLEKKGTELERMTMDEIVKSRSAIRSIDERDQLIDNLETKDIKSNAMASAYNKIFQEVESEIHQYEQMDHIKSDNYELTYVPEAINDTDMFPEDLGNVNIVGRGSVQATKSSAAGSRPSKQEKDKENEKQMPAVTSAPPAATLPSAPAFNQEPLRYGSHMKTFNTLEPTDQTKCYVVGIAWISSQYLIAIDRWNRKVKLVNEDGILVHSYVVQVGEPTDVAYTKSVANRDSCVVTIPSACMIGQVTITNKGKIGMPNSIRTAIGYTSVAYDRVNSRLVCGVCQPFGFPRVDIVNPNGSIHMSFAVDSSQAMLFAFPRSLDVAANGIISVCDWKKIRIVFLRSDGKIMSAYQGSSTYPLKDCVGTTLDDRGHILVSERRSNCIHVVTLNGEVVCPLATDERLSDPREINLTCVDNDYKLAISHGTGLISIFRLSENVPTPTFRYEVAVDFSTRN